ncbi:ATP-binding cassette domain-containing protein [Thiogranum longum]
MPILRTRNLRVGFGGPPILDGLDFSIEAGERVCLVGRNGSGKSTLLKVLEGRITPDEGEIERTQNLKIASLDQELPDACPATVFEFVAQGLGRLGELMGRFHQLSVQLEQKPDKGLLKQLERIQHELESSGAWTLEQQVETVLSRLALDPDARFDQLSGGVQRRVLLARALACAPDLLLLDEPTNHLDIQAIEWLEDFLGKFRGTLLFITHDRSFLSSLATRIVDLDRGVLTDWPGNYQAYLRHKQEWLENEANRNAAFDKKLAQEENWIRQGIKARRTRNEGRVRALEKMRQERRKRRQLAGAVRLRTPDVERSGKLVVEAVDAAYSIPDRPLIRNLNTVILRGDKVGIIGPNGAGKTTLLRLLLGEIEPAEGEIRLGTKLDVAYFDQRRAQLDPNRSVIDNLADGRQFIETGNRQRHVISYLQDFLFSPQRCQTPVSALSGGERNRLLLAKLFSKHSNLLVLDEPTNDLDIDTLDLLEARLVEYAGTVLLVSHDRTFLDRVVSSTLVFEGNGIVNEYVGGYSDWLHQRQAGKPDQSGHQKIPSAPTRKPQSRPGKLSYKDQRELESLPLHIEQLESQIEQINVRMSDPAFYQLPGDEIASEKERLSGIQEELHDAYRRWEHLEQKNPD